MSDATNPIDGTRIYFEDDGGAGAPVVIHGGFLDPVPLVRRSPTAEALRPFSDEFRTVFVDHRGHGRSDRPHDPSAYAIALRVADAISVLDTLGIDAAHFVGLSWGARLGFGIGHHAPERVRSLVLIGQHPYAIDTSGRLARLVGTALEASQSEGIQALVEAFEAIVGRYPDDVRTHYLACDAAAMRAAWAAAIVEGDIATDLRGWRTRCLIAVAEEDVDFFEQARRAAEEIPAAVFLPVEREHHLGMDTARIDPLLPAILRTLRDSGEGVAP
jgi:pimeloyl-ACP methyl ester carboxylesterase